MLVTTPSGIVPGYAARRARFYLAGNPREIRKTILSGSLFVVRVLSGIKHVVSATQQHYFHIRHPDAIARAVKRYT